MTNSSASQLPMPCGDDGNTEFPRESSELGFSHSISASGSKGKGLCLEQIRASYGKKEILWGVSAQAQPGEVVCILGPNGAGKSTLLKVAAGLLRASTGRVQFDGQDISGHLPFRRARLGLGYSMQGGQVFASLTVRECLETAVLPLPRQARVSAINQVLDIFPTLRSKLTRRAGLLSGGERQLLALAMVQAKRPSVLLLDEPTAGLAPDVAHRILDAVRLLNCDYGVAVVLVEHRIREALQLANRAILLVNGLVRAETSTPQAWTAEGALDVFYFGTNSEVVRHPPEVKAS